MNEFGLSEKTMSALTEIFSKYSSVQKAIIYGSRAKGNFKEGSDIDIALVPKNIFSEELIKMAGDFDDSMLPYYVDLCDFSSLKNTDLIEHINRVGKVIYER